MNFKHVMKIWSAFSANDLNNDNELDANEVKCLFWLFDGKRPSKEKIQRETEIMDEDKSGTIDRLEWLAYLCSSGVDGSTGKGKDYYDFELRETFEAADRTKTGTLTPIEMEYFLKLDMKELLDTIPQEKRGQLDRDFKKCAVDAFEILMGRLPTGKTDAMTWVDMKNYRNKCKERIERLEKTIMTISIEEKNLSLMEQSYMAISGGNNKNELKYVTTATPEPLTEESVEQFELSMKKQLHKNDTLQVTLSSTLQSHIASATTVDTTTIPSHRKQD